MTTQYLISNLQFPISNLRSLIIFVYLALAVLFALTTPPWQNPDEPAHYNYVAYVATQGRLPVLQMGDYDQAYLQQLKDEKFPPALSVAPVRYEFHQPPLYYVLAAPVYWLSGGSLLALRLLSVLIGAGVIWLLFLCFQTVFPHKPAVVLAATVFVAFLPMHIAILSAVNNDSLAELIIAGGLLVLLRWMKDDKVTRRGGDKEIGRQGEGETSQPHVSRFTHYATRNRHLLLLSLLIALGFWTKATAYILFPVAILTIAASAITQSPNHPAPTRLRHALSSCHPVTLSSLFLGLPLWLRNIAVYGSLDFLGLRWHDQVVTGQPTTAAWIAANGWVAYGQRAWDFTFKSFWGVFGWLGVFMDGRVYTLLLILSAIVAAGLAAGLLRRAPKHAPVSEFQRWGLFVALLLLAGVAASYVWYNLGFVQHQGRYLFPALYAMGLLVALGWQEALRPRVSLVMAGLLLLWAVIVAGTGLAGGTLDRWTLLFLVAATGALGVNGLLERISGGARLRSMFYALPFLLLILLDAAIPFLYTVPQLTR